MNIKPLLSRGLLIAFILGSGPLMANTWPTKETKLGCEFKFNNYAKFDDYTKSETTLKIKKNLPFPWLDFKSTNNPLKKTKVHLFCNDICLLKANEFDADFKKIFPLEINKKVTIDVNEKSIFTVGVAKIVIKVLNQRKSPYLVNSTEYLIETSIGRNSIIDDEPYYVTVRRLWWNTTLGFYTEMISPFYTYRIKSASCLEKNSLIQYKNLSEQILLNSMLGWIDCQATKYVSDNSNCVGFS